MNQTTSRLKVLYAIQGTGNGHVARAREILPLLAELADVDVLLSADQSQVKLPLPITYSVKGLTFIYDAHGAISYRKTFLKNNPFVFFMEMIKLPLKSYDLIINDFESVTAWGGKLKGVPVVGLSHQGAVLEEHAPKPLKGDRLGEFILKWYAPVRNKYCFHFEKWGKNMYTPVIRSEIRAVNRVEGNHYLVYLPAYDGAYLKDYFTSFKKHVFEIYSKSFQEETTHKNTILRPISGDAFAKSFAGCKGMITSAGFETPAECLHHGIKVIVIPIQGQYEQLCNAAGLEFLGVPVLKQLNEEAKPLIKKWLKKPNRTPRNYPDQTREILEELLLEAQKNN